MPYIICMSARLCFLSGTDISLILSVMKICSVVSSGIHTVKPATIFSANQGGIFVCCNAYSVIMALMVYVCHFLIVNDHIINI
jgi:hypothetical protein